MTTIRTMCLSVLILVSAAAMAATWSHAAQPSNSTGIDPYAMQLQFPMRAMLDQSPFWSNF